MRAVIVVRTAPGEHVPAAVGQAVPGGIPDEPAPRACTELTKAGEPCKGTPGPDGLCAAHKPKGDADAGAVPPAVDADQAQAGGEG